MKNPVQAKLGGFTLIELLVVVLIIGILSAIALPQYEKAVLKAQLVQAMNLYAPYHQALDGYIMANGFPSGDDRVYFTGNGIGASSGYTISSLEVSYPVVNQSTYWDEVVIGGKHASVSVYITSTAALVGITGVGDQKYLQGCGVMFQKRQSKDKWELAGVTIIRGSFGTAYEWSTAANECTDVKKLMCTYWKSNGTGAFPNGMISDCAAVGVDVN